MSRIGKQPVNIPNGLEVKVDGNIIHFKKGNISKELNTKGNVLVKVENDQLVFLAKGEDRQEKAFWGTYRALSNNIIIGLTSGFERK
ncbi:MAG: 50S ribosomal protein L6, partial [Campylobacteraceae bacterium]|nr:50S ribosomal protein L6 [Campylobacteraceae bacterium]